MAGLTFEKLLLIGVIAMFIFGPERLPELASQLASWIKRARAWADGAKDRAKEELGEDFDVDQWRKLDPRQYDPRRIIRDAWNEAGSETSAAPAASTTATATAIEASAPSWAAFGGAGADKLVPGHAPFDTEAT
nr:twin-arginine translocase TatA/TatE family subunit [Pseudoclavibacter sp. Marseille-Q3772]